MSSTASTPDLKAILEYGVEAASTANTALALDNYSADLQKLQNEQGVTVHRTSKEILDAQLKAWDEMIPTLEADEFMKRVLDSQRAWVERVVFYELDELARSGACLQALLPRQD